MTPQMPRNEGFPYALDNGAWGAHQRGEDFPAEPFTRTVKKLGAGADWVVAPDIVEGGLDSLRVSIGWLSWLRSRCKRILIAVQDGMTEKDIRPLLSDRVGVFVGGSTDWKLQTLDTWCRLARDCGAWSHVGRVNTARRIRRCLAAGATSFDGTSASRYAVTCSKLDSARRQLVMGELL